jgi:hypothetical protein
MDIALPWGSASIPLIGQHMACQVAPVEIVEMGGSKSVLCYATCIAGPVPDAMIVLILFYVIDFKR